MRMLVLAGGFGTRLQSKVRSVPKAMAPIGPIPFLYLQIQNWINQGVRSFTFLLHHQADQIISFLDTEKSGLLKDCRVDYIVEPTPMDTGGAVAYAVQTLLLTGNFLLANADTWIGSGIQEMACSSAPSMAVLRMRDASRYGRVKVDDEFQVTVFEEKSHRDGPAWINTGLYNLNSDLFKKWNGEPFSLEQVLFPRLVRCGTLKAVELHADFIDIGIPSDYLRFCQWNASERVGTL
jgi:D-glycero-alpha-D-manno-heptose 1-phosphate guanylyltransferase